ncbi:MAG: hemerythrin domain-containing protein [Legionella sp.]|nr:hemerythrin domain-containing protein [Legionella sp.]
MKESINLPNQSIFDLLIADHTKHRHILNKIEHSREFSEIKAWVDEFLLEAQAHACAEEQALYSFLMQHPDLTGLVRHSVAEHKELEDLIEKLTDVEPLSEPWNDLFSQLQKRYLHHINEEEEDVFTAALKQLSSSEKDEMGKIFKARKPIEKNTLASEESD